MAKATEKTATVLTEEQVMVRMGKLLKHLPSTAARLRVLDYHRNKEMESLHRQSQVPLRVNPEKATAAGIESLLDGQQ